MALIIGIHDLSGSSLTLIDPEFFSFARHHIDITLHKSSVMENFLRRLSKNQESALFMLYSVRKKVTKKE
ncbi:hypothetical protein [Pseudomonas sp. GM60]|uniref:hypothetical protein n=1 Tax=Pseudomonas sp. GM60 TaxID=1144334 RepID=UPI0012FB84AB|nr:hypothetical protein [Pseudomonas sp. GM60]